MPYRKGFRATLENISDHPITVYYQIDCERKKISEDALYFHAQFRRTNPLPYKGVYTILDGIKGNGQYVGTYLYWGANNNGWWGCCSSALGLARCFPVCFTAFPPDSAQTIPPTSRANIWAALTPSALRCS